MRISDWSSDVCSSDLFITIGTGGQTGVYYQVGGAVCRLVNRNTDEHHIKCTHTTGGSVDNINGIRNGDPNSGAAQSDCPYHATNGTSPDTFPPGPFNARRPAAPAAPGPLPRVAPTHPHH